MPESNFPRAASNESTSKQNDDLYLTLAPRGIESFVISNIKSQLTSNGYTCWIREIEPSLSTKLKKTWNGDSHEGPIVRKKLGCHLEDVAARIEYNKYKKRSKKRKKEMRTKAQSAEASSHTVDFDTFLSQKPDLSRVTGSVDVPEIQSHVSLGYHTLRDGENSEGNPSDGLLQRILSVPGTTEGIAFLSFRTNAPPTFVASMSGMGCGPLLALITSSCLQMRSEGQDTNSNDLKINEDGKILDYDQTLEQSCSFLEAFFKKNKDHYFDHFQSALRLWHEHAEKVWDVPDSIYGEYHKQSRDKTESVESSSGGSLIKPKPRQQPFSYRLSCMRTHSNKYLYQRESLLPYLGHWVIPWDDLHQIKLRSRSGSMGSNVINEDHVTKHNTSSEGCDWVVNLKEYDFEIVTIIHSCCVSVAIPLRPYQLWSSKAYSSNTLPTDGTGMFGRIGADARTNSKHRNSSVHLRPSTADILISIANLPRHSVILDPCAGIGTVTIRASLQSHFGLGGDILPALFQQQAPYFHDCNRKFQQRQYRGAADIAGWDATMLPVRESIADAVISDIPFGQKCLCHNELNAFLSGFVYECARVLVENNGKMILLCGDYDIVLSSLVSLNERSAGSKTSDPGSRPSAGQNVFLLPCDSVFPINISGILAWVIVVRRGHGVPIQPTHYRERPKKRNLSYLR